MFGVQKILVGVDLVANSDQPDVLEFPPPTIQAVGLALDMAERDRLPVTFFSVSSLPAEDGDDPAQNVLDGLLTDAEARGVSATCKRADGRAWMEIIREVQREGHDLVVVGSRNHRTRQLLLGTTGTKLLRKCPCPVWVARPDTSPEGQVPVVVVADDLTEVGGHCVQLGVSAAQTLDAKLLVTHAVQYPLESSLRRSGCVKEDLETYRAKQNHEATDGVNEHLAQTDARTLTHGVRVDVQPGPPDLVILNAIEEHNADLLVMGTIARTGIPGLLVGNTAERLLTETECSILAVKPDGFESPVRPG